MPEVIVDHEKCTGCGTCVEVCPVGARKFGNLLDPESEVSQALASRPATVLLPEHGTKPRVFYQGLDERVIEKRGRRTP